MGTHSRSLALSLSLLLAIASAPLGAGEGNDVLETVSEEYPIPHHGVLTLDVPVPWQAVFYQPLYKQFPSITFSPLKSKSFQLFVTVFWNTAYDGDLSHPESIRQLVERVGEEALVHSDEEELMLKPIEGTDLPGYLFDLSDESAPEGDYKYLTQGAIGVDDLVLTCTLLAHERDSREREAAPEMLKSARQREYRQDVRASLPLTTASIAGNSPD